MQLQITNIRGQLGIIRHDAVLSIRQPRAQVKMNTVPTELNMRTEHIKVKIDQSQCFRETGLKSVLELSDESAALGRQAVLDGVARVVDEGNILAMIENKSNAVVEIALDQTFTPPADFNVDLMPKSRPKIEFVGGEVNFDPVLGGVNIEVQVNPPEISATPASIEYFWHRQPFFRMEFIGNNIDLLG